jgi:simple sugar transport system ATP-binding protein
MNTYLHISNITKKFGAFTALDQIDIKIEKSSIHAILGENGAGKTTLMNIIYGLYQPDDGQLFLNGSPVTITNPRQALNMGIGMIHQHLMLVDTLSVTENIILGLAGTGPHLSLKAHEERIANLSKTFNFDIDPQAQIWKLPMGMRQRVEILKALYRDVDLLILDEPTSVLAPNEIESFLEGLNRLRAAGKTILFITHKLDEVVKVADRVTVMRQGKITGHKEVKNSDAKSMARMMVQRDVVTQLDKIPVPLGSVALQVKDATVTNNRGLTALKGINLNVRSGEVVGVAGVDGNGQAELAEIITGMRELSSGQVLVNGKDITRLSVAERRHKHHIGYVPEDRHGTGLVLDYSVEKNCILRDFKKPQFSLKTWLKSSNIQSFAQKCVNDYDVRLQSIEQQIRYLSGGNQQKIVFAREIEANPDILIVMQPCKGLDVGAIEAVQKTILLQKQAGKAVLYISTELDDILAVCDRIAVMCAGDITGEVTPEEATPERIGMLMAGIKEVCHD